MWGTGWRKIAFLNIRATCGWIQAMTITKETSRHYAFLMKDYTHSRNPARKPKPVSDETASPLPRKHRENILSNTTGMQSAYFTLQKILQDQKKVIPTNKLQRERKKEMEGKPMDWKKFARYQPHTVFISCLNSNYNTLKKPKPSFLGQLKKWKQSLDFKDIKKFIVFLCFEWACENNIVVYMWNNAMSRLYFKITVWVGRGRWGYQENKRLGDGYMTVYSNYCLFLTISEIFLSKKLK